MNTIPTYTLINHSEPIMKSLKKRIHKQSAWWTTLFAIALFALSGCSIDGLDNQTEEITEADLEAAGQIIGESISDENSGVMGSLNDAVATFSSSGFENFATKSSSAGNDDDDENSGRGHESNFSHSYDPETGTHTIIFTRSINRGEFFKTVTDTLKYIFTDTEGNFIAFPRQNRDRVETIDFKGIKEGNVNLPEKTSFFVRTDTFFIDGFSDASSILSIDGVHNGEGDFQGSDNSGNTLERKYSLEFNFLNIEVDKAIVEANQSLEQGVTGSLTYEIVIENTRNGSSSSKTLRGNVEFNGDGTALLRFQRFQKLFQINLDDGDVRDGDKEFEGRVSGISTERDVVELTNGRRIVLTDNTEIEFGDRLNSLNDVATALEEGFSVRAEGEGSIRDGSFIADEIEFELKDSSNDDDSDERERVEFEEIVVNTNPENSTFELDGGRIILIDDSTEIDDDGDFKSLEEVNEALELDDVVIADGEGRKTDKEGIDLVAVEIRFDRKE